MKNIKINIANKEWRKTSQQKEKIAKKYIACTTTEINIENNRKIN